MDSSIRASDLVKIRQTNDKMKQKNYFIEYQKCVERIKSVNKNCESDHTFYTLPVVLASDPNYDVNECAAYIKEKLRGSEFYVRLRGSENTLFISWDPDLVTKVKKKLQVEKEKEKLTDIKLLKQNTIDYNGSAIGTLHLTSNLMKKNPKYSALFNKK
jgi:hypothetical protein